MVMEDRIESFMNKVVMTSLALLMFTTMIGVAYFLFTHKNKATCEVTFMCKSGASYTIKGDCEQISLPDKCREGE
jgi:hypothetical protein